MATINKTLKTKPKPRSPILTLFIFLAAIALLCLFFSLVSTNGFSLSSTKITLKNLMSPGNKNSRTHVLPDKILYWGNRIDCPGKHCESCEGLGHQESSLRCALEEAMLLNRTFVMPSRMCINPIHNKKGILHNSDNASSQERFMECKDRKNRSSIMLPYSFLPSMAAPKLRDAANKVKALLGDYDAIHVRRGDKIKTRKDRFGVERTLHPHLDRDTHPEFIMRRIEKWVQPGRTLFIASNERTPDFFAPLSVRYNMAYSWNFSRIIDPLIENNYQLFMIERLIMMGAKTFIRTYKDDDTDLSLTDDPKKNTKSWQIPVYTMDEEGS
ncbi:uncharacterized protein LOC120012357 isoform X2 [Tripterygium wilfordii]|uniref:uncharacterized protein LOC120012357 isoform X2 n=1 Tax=Tripterygium wilfordii TaxID=458696 RepID=UPI0018F7EF95|nr:uncharacterized protein LOC120012357 isoform X2 [Tripterygium wilfordii]